MFLICAHGSRLNFLAGLIKSVIKSFGKSSEKCPKDLYLVYLCFSSPCATTITDGLGVKNESSRVLLQFASRRFTSHFAQGRTAAKWSATSRYTHLWARDRVELGAILESHVGAVASDGCVNLVAHAAGLAQAPLAAARPPAIVHHRGVNGLAHHRFRFDAGVESSEISCAVVVNTPWFTSNNQAADGLSPRVGMISS